MKFETTILGRVGRDPETREFNGKKVTTYSVATKPGKDKTVWVKVTTWDKAAENDEKYVRKGMLVYARGVLQSDDSGNPRTYEKDGVVKVSGFELTAYEVKYLTKVEVAEPTTESPSLDLSSDEIPF